jgi:hypothetical protein
VSSVTARWAQGSSSLHARFVERVLAVHAGRAARRVLAQVLARVGNARQRGVALLLP